jgi:hypothetical protein
MLAYKITHLMLCQKTRDNPYAIIVIKLETKKGRLIINDKFNVSDIPCSQEESVLECVQKAFLLCDQLIVKDSLVISKNEFMDMLMKMKDLLQSQKLADVEYTKKLDCNYGMLVKAISSSTEKLNIGSLVLFTNDKNFGNVQIPKSNDSMNWESMDKEMEAAGTLIPTNIPLVHAEVENDEYKFSLDGIVIDKNQNVVSLYVLPETNEVITIEQSKCSKLFQRKIENLNPTAFLRGSNFNRRKILWNIHVQFRADMSLIKKSVTAISSRCCKPESIMIHTPVCKACITRDDQKFCASVFLI